MYGGPAQISTSLAAESESDMTAYTLTGLDNGTTYEFAVSTSNETRYGRADDDTDDSDWTAIVTGTPVAAEGTPENLTATGWIDSIRLSWEWTDSPDYPLYGFRVRWRSSLASTFDPADQVAVGASAREYVVDLSTSTVDGVFIVEVTAASADAFHGTATVAASASRPTDYFLDEILPTYYDTDHPWMRDAWERTLVPMSEREASGADISFGAYIQNGWLVKKAYDIVLSRDLWDTLLEAPADGLASDGYGSLVHELAHALTVDVRSVSEPLAVLWLYHLLWLGGDDSCLVYEVLADTVSLDVDPLDETSGYYDRCQVMGSLPTPEAAEVTAEVLDGNVPQWFTDRYGLPDGSMNTEAVWLDLTDPGLLGEDPEVQRLFAEAISYGFRKSFGGFCSHVEAAESFRALLNDDPDDDAGVTHDPWVDGGCESRLPRDVAVARQAFSLELDWEAPLWVRQPAVDAYLVQWKRGSQEYSADRQMLITGLENTSAQIGGLPRGEDYQVRIAAVDSSRPGILVDGKGFKRYVEVEVRALT